MQKFLFLITLFSIISIPASRSMNPYWNDINMNYPNEKVETSQYKIIEFDRTITINQLPHSSFVMIFDASGRNIYKKTVKGSSISVPVRYKGIYIIRIKSDKDVFTQKILVN